MQWLDISLATLEENLALDEALLLEAEVDRTGEVLRVWEWPVLAVILGAGGRLTDDVDAERCRTDGVPILRRSSGGGTVLLGAGCLCFSLVLSYERSPALREIPFSYAWILDIIAAALGDLVPGIERAGTSDLAVAGRKCSGNSQQRKRKFLLHHGTLLYAFNFESVGRYLRIPERQPDYRQRRDHRDFLCNLPADAGELKRRLQSAWHAGPAPATIPTAQVRELVEQKYSRPDWLRRR
jgi:lipoate-protein ligase A